MIPCSTKAQQKSTHTLKHTTGTPNKADTSAAGTGKAGLDSSYSTHECIETLGRWDATAQCPNGCLHSTVLQKQGVSM